MTGFSHYDAPAQSKAYRHVTVFSRFFKRNHYKYPEKNRSDADVVSL